MISTLCVYSKGSVVDSSNFSSARECPCGLRAFAEVFPVPTFRNVQLCTAGAFEAAEIASLCHKQRTSIIQLLGVSW